MIPVTPPDGSSWSLGTEPTADGVQFVLHIPEMGLTVRMQASRAEARAFAAGTLAAAGDGTERTFPHPAIEEH